MKKILFLLAFISMMVCTVSAQSTKDQKNPLITKYIIGKPYMQYFDAEKIVAQRWGINIKHIFAGCVLTSERREFRKSLEKKNKKATDFYTKKFGKGWQKKFQREVDQELVKIKSTLPES